MCNGWCGLCKFGVSPATLLSACNVEGACERSSQRNLYAVIHIERVMYGVDCLDDLDTFPCNRYVASRIEVLEI